MSPLVRPAVLPVCAATSGGNSDKWAPRQQRSWWGKRKQSLPHQPGGGGGRGGGGGGGALDQVLGVLRRDGEFLQAAAGGSLRDALWLRFLEKKQQQRKRPIPKPAEQQQQAEAAPPHPQAPAFPAYPPGLSCVELVMADLQALKVYADSSKQELVLRFLGSKQQPQSQQQSTEPKPVSKKQPKPKPNGQPKEQKQQQALQAPAFPPHPHPPGLSCMELMMADADALKLYVNYFLAILSTPLPQHYDPDLLAQYFVSRPHILVFRTVQILFAFLVGAVKVQMFKRASLTTDATHSSSVSNEGFDASQFMVGQLLKDTFLDLGPTFIKVGQSLSTRPDILGSEISEALAELHERVPPFPREDAMKIVEGEFERPVSQVFSYISDEPVASASFGQVYQGRTFDGALVAIKVQRPNLLPSVLRDIYILRLGLSFVRKIAKRRSNISLYADELGRGFVDELDYNIEAANATKFLETHSKYSFVMVPKVLKQLTRKRVLTMEWVAGENPRELLSLAKGISGNIAELPEKQKLGEGQSLEIAPRKFPNSPDQRPSSRRSKS